MSDDIHDSGSRETDIEQALRRELLASTVAFDGERADQMIATATAGGLRTDRRWAAPAAAAAAVVLVGGAAAWIAGAHQGGGGTPAGDGGCDSSSSTSAGPARLLMTQTQKGSYAISGGRVVTLKPGEKTSSDVVYHSRMLIWYSTDASGSSDPSWSAGSPLPSTTGASGAIASGTASDTAIDAPADDSTVPCATDTNDPAMITVSGVQVACDSAHGGPTRTCYRFTSDPAGDTTCTYVDLNSRSGKPELCLTKVSTGDETHCTIYYNGQAPDVNLGRLDPKAKVASICGLRAGSWTYRFVSSAGAEPATASGSPTK